MKFVSVAIDKILSLVGLRRISRPNRSPSKNIFKSSVQYPQLIHVLGRIQYSELRGRVSIGPYSLIHKTILEGEISVGRNTTINGPGTESYCFHNPITIGSFCSIARGTSIQEYNHNWKTATTYFIRHRIFNEPYGSDVVSKGKITIGNDVWIGAQCVILSGVTIGDGAVIAANSVVANDIPPYAIVGGSPAKVIKYRFERSVIDKLLEIKWWEWDEGRLKQNKEFFLGELTFEKIGEIK